MENAVDALKMAAAVMTFVMALGISISSFSEARQTAQIIIDYTDRESVTQYTQDIGTKERIVGKETIVPTLYRAYKENYKILFYDKNGNELSLYTKIEKGTRVDVNYIDLERDVLGNNRQKDNFIMALLYGNKATLQREDGTTMSFDEFTKELAKNNSGMTLNSQGIYDTILEGNTFLEKFGIYYQEDIQKQNTDTDIDNEYHAETPDTNKTKKRVISYYMQ